jgi:hypothetical protein
MAIFLKPHSGGVCCKVSEAAIFLFQLEGGGAEQSTPSCDLSFDLSAEALAQAEALAK